MKLLMLDDLAFTKDTIRVIERVKYNETWGIDFHILVDYKTRYIHRDFSDLLANDNRGSKLAYDYLVSWLMNEQSGILNIDNVLHSQSVLFRGCIEEFTSNNNSGVDLQKAKENVLYKFREYLLSFESELFVK